MYILLYHNTRKPTNHVGQIIDSPVVSFSIYDELANGTLPDPLLTPVIVEFQSIDAVNRSGPQCVYWDFELWVVVPFFHFILFYLQQ